MSRTDGPEARIWGDYIPSHRTHEAWQLAQTLARSGRYPMASHVVDIVCARGFSRETELWLDDGELARLDGLCRRALLRQRDSRR